MKQRYIDLDIIKVLASIMVIMLHLGNVYMRSPYFGDAGLHIYGYVFCYRNSILQHLTKKA